MDPEDLVPVYTVQSPAEAEIVRNALQAVGIPCEIGGWGQAGLAGVLEIELLVHASDAAAARKHMRNLQREKVQREKQRMEAKRAKAADATSEAIQAPKKAKAADAMSEAIQELPTAKQPPETPQ